MLEKQVSPFHIGFKMVQFKYDEKGEKGPEENLPKEILQQYKLRLSYLKQGKEYYRAEDFVNATRCYNIYLKTLSNYKRTEENKLHPNLFDLKKELPELLLISHTYWDLARIYDRTPKLKNEFIRVLSQFVLFTTGFKYQVPNAGMLKRFIKKKKYINKADFTRAAEQLKVGSKKCFVATYSFGENHIITNQFREVRTHLIKNHLGLKFVKSYNKVSPIILNILEDYPHFSKIFRKFIARPFLLTLIVLLKPKSIQDHLRRY